MMSEKQKLMPQGVWGALGVIACFVIWLAFALMLWLSSGIAEDSVGLAEMALFAAPVVFFIFPVVWDAVKKGASARATWALAAAPILGLLNLFAAIVLTIIFVKLFGRNEINYLIAVFCAVIIWVPLLRKFLISDKR